MGLLPGNVIATLLFLEADMLPNAETGRLMQIINHGAVGVITKMKAAVADFFDLPLSEKRKYAMATNDVQGYGQGYVVSQDQKLDWNDLLFLIALPPDSRNIKYWPLTIPGFKYVTAMMPSNTRGDLSRRIF